MAVKTVNLCTGILSLVSGFGFVGYGLYLLAQSLQNLDKQCVGCFSLAFALLYMAFVALVKD